eukprot:6683218-Ditylum_brightwellii.AAC.1
MLLIFYPPQVEVTIDDGSDINKEWITGTTSDVTEKLQPLKVLANQLLCNFDELARPFNDFPAHLMQDVVKSIPETDNIKGDQC